MKREEAINIVRNIYHTDKEKKALETLIPELTESEDERIRKELVSYLTDIIDNICSEEDIPHDAKILGGKIRNWISYLEKQKDANKEYWRGYREGKQEILDKYAEIEKQKEQKSKEDKCNGCNNVKGCITCVDGDQWAHIYDEHNPAELNFPHGVNETVDKLIAIAECLEMDGDCSFNGYSGIECGKFLRELARKQIECKPMEWNEKDEAMLEDIIDDYDNGEIMGDVIGKVMWLTSLPLELKKRKDDVEKLCSNEWNEEDEKMLKWIKDTLLITYDDLNDKLKGRVISPITDSAYSSIKSCITKCISWIESHCLSCKPSKE